ncbi:MAG: carbon storage regulator CsrA [bacterium]|jgi:carbon storage regulator
MLVLSRRKDESIIIGRDIEITIVDIQGDKVRIGIKAPKNITVHRREIFREIEKANRQAVQADDEGLEAFRQLWQAAERNGRDN